MAMHSAQESFEPFVGVGDEVYPNDGSITSPTRRQGFGLQDRELPRSAMDRMQHGDLIEETATRTGCGGEAYCRVAATRLELEQCGLPVGNQETDRDRHVIWNMLMDAAAAERGEKPEHPLFDNVDNVVVKQWREGIGKRK